MSKNEGLNLYYKNNQDEIEASWEEKLSYMELGSGEDKIKVTDNMFWEYVEEGFLQFTKKELGSHLNLEISTSEDISSVYESNKLKLTELLDSDYELKYKVKDLINYWNSYLS